MRRLAAVVAGRRSAASSAGGDAASEQPGMSPTANSYISLGAFETMGGDIGRASTGLAYMQEALKVQEAAYDEEEDPRRRTRRGLSLAQSVVQVGRQHHQLQDARAAIEHYLRAQALMEDFINLHTPLAIAEQQARDAAEAASSEAAADRAEMPAPKKPAEAAPDSALKRALDYARFSLTEVFSSLGIAYNDVGDKDKALEALQQCLTLRKETVGKNHPSMAECFNNLGAVYLQRGALQKASEHYEQALEQLMIAADGRQEGAYQALTLYNIGICRARLGHGREAGAALHKALSLAESALGSQHRQVELIRETIRQMTERPPAADADASEAAKAP